MTSIEKLSLDLALIRSVYRTGDFTPAEVIREVYRRIRTHDKDSDSIWVWLRDEEDSINRAREIAERLDLPLAGVPFALSDNIDAAGIPTTAGCPQFAYVPEESATVVRLLEAAGAILIGKTCLDQFGVGLSGLHGGIDTRHSAYSKDCIPGGPASGAALAVADGMVSFALGTDMSGAGQVSAAYNHLVAIKPTHGIVSTKGFVPGCRSLDCASVFASCVSDAASVLDVLVVEDPGDPWSRVARSPVRFARPFRFGVPSAEYLDFNSDLDSEICFLRAIERLEGLGGVRIEIDFSPFQEASELADCGAWAAERFGEVGEFVETHRASIDPAVAQVILNGKSVNAVEVFRATYQQEALRKRTTEIWNGIDALVVPTTPTTFQPDYASQNSKEVHSILRKYTGFINLFDLASVTVPTGFRTDNIPFSISLIAPAFYDWELCRLAKMIAGETLSVRNQKNILHDEQSDILLVVTGTHMTGGTMNHELISRRATFHETVETAPDYALYALDTEPRKPGLISMGPMMGVSIEAEIWALAPEAFGNLVANIVPPMCVGNVRLKDGRHVKGFLCEEYATRKATPISAFGGWRGFLAASGQYNTAQ